MSEPIIDHDPQPPGGLPGWLTAAVDTPNPQPFDGHDPLALDELTREQRAWRAVLHLLAVHGGHIRIPHVLAPDAVALAVAGGWRYLSELADDGNDTILTCRFTRDAIAARDS